MRLSKREELLKLGEKRRKSQWPRYKGIGDFHDGIYECDFVSPYTKSAGNVDAEVMVLLQDWSSEDRLSGPVDEDARTLGYSSDIPTNVNLKRLLNVHFDVMLSGVYGTNLFPFIKLGGMSARIPQKDLLRAAVEFAIPQINIVSPRIVVCLGLQTFNALRVASGLLRVRNIGSGIEAPFFIEDTQVWCQAHTGTLGRNNRNRGGVDRVSQDWERMAGSLRRVEVS